MTGHDGDKREPLWASSLAERPRPADDDVRPLEARADPASQPQAPTGIGRRRAALGVVALVTVIVAALAAALPGRGSWSLQDVPSFWGAVQMTCHTLRLERDDHSVELFRCRATGGGTLPPGLYRSPVDTWTSDITRRDALANEIRITPDGELRGWAAYRT